MVKFQHVNFGEMQTFTLGREGHTHRDVWERGRAPCHVQTEKAERLPVGGPRMGRGGRRPTLGMQTAAALLVLQSFPPWSPWKVPLLPGITAHPGGGWLMRSVDYSLKCMRQSHAATHHGNSVSL